MKKTLVLIGSISFIIIGALMFMAAPYLATATFKISNKTNETVSLVATWREQEKNIGSLKAGGQMEFKANDEAAMQFIATFNSNKIISNRPIYFTSGTKINVEIHDNELLTKYE